MSYIHLINKINYIKALALAEKYPYRSSEILKVVKCCSDFYSKGPVVDDKCGRIIEFALEANISLRDSAFLQLQIDAALKG